MLLGEGIAKMGLGHSPIVVSEGLVFYFDPINTRSYAGTGLTGYNLINTAIVGTFTNGPAYDSANKGSINFDGVDDYIDFGSSTTFKLIDNFTLSAWVKSTVYGDRAIVGNFGPSTDYSGFNLNIQPSNKFAFLTGSAASATYLYSNDTFLLNKWYHLTAVRSNGTNYLYVNGVGQSSTNTQVVKYSNQNFYFGKWYSNLTGFYHNGHIASAALYNRALSSTEILQNYNATKKRFSPEENIVTNGLVLYYDAGNNSSYAGTGNTAFSVVGIGYTATLVNGPTFTSTAGGGFVFNGTFKYILMPSVIDSNNDLTVSFWNRRLSTGSIHNLLHGVDQSAYFQVRYNASNAVQLVKSNAADMGSFTGYTSTANNDVYLTVRFTKSSNTYDLYINGSYISSITNAQTFVTNGPLLGSGYPGSEHFNGYIYSFTYYNRVLTSTEILQNYNALKSRYGLS
jgi:hypothetical protein